MALHFIRFKPQKKDQSSSEWGVYKPRGRSHKKTLVILFQAMDFFFDIPYFPVDLVSAPEEQREVDWGLVKER